MPPLWKIGILFGIEAHEFHAARMLRFEHSLLDHLARCTTDVERPHGQLGPRLADGLRGNDTDGLTLLDQAAPCQIAAITRTTDTAAGLTGQYRTDFDPIDRSFHDILRPFLGNLLIERHDYLAGYRVPDIFRRQSTQDTLFDGLNDFSAFNQRTDE